MLAGQSSALAVVLAVATALPAFAQGSANATQSAPNREYVSGAAGIVASSTASPVFSAEFGEDLHPRVQAYVTFSYLDNVMSQALRDEIQATETKLRVLTGDPWDLRGRDRGLALTFGGKYRFGEGVLRPYAGGGAGVVKITRTIIDAHLGDVTLALFNDFNVGDGDLARAPEGLFRPLVEAVGGVGFDLGHTYIDIGYRYRAALGLDTTLDFSQVTIGIGYRF